MQPLVTIVTPSFNQGQFIEKTILSVLNQTYKNIQYIIIDGGSTDNTMDVVQRYSDRIDIVVHEKDRGQSDAINKGFLLAKGDLVGWLNSDDILYDKCIEKIVDLYISKPGGSVYYNAVIDIINVDGAFIKKYSNIIPHKDFLLKKKYSICQQGSFYAKKLLDEVNYLDVSLHYCMDLDLWLRLLTKGPIYSIKDKSYAAFRDWETAKTSTGGERFLCEIRNTLFRHGAKIWHDTIRQTYWYQFKILIRDMVFKYKKMTKSV